MQRQYGRIERFDDKSRGYGISNLLTTPSQKPVSNEWQCDVVLDQGAEGSCVGHAWAHELAAYPAPVAGVTHEAAVEIYYDAQRNDPWPGGEYPEATPKYSGSSVLGGAKACMMRGLIGGYYWAFLLDELVLGLGHQGPAVLGVRWYDGMAQPDRMYRIKPKGRVQGGHAILARAVDVEYELIMLHNSWGPDWGKEGRCYITFDDMDKLLNEGGEACFALGRRTEPLRKDSYL
jgi:hypothetical protein